MRMPAVFCGHGNPLNALGSNRWTDGWGRIGKSLRPRAVLAISAHWYVPATMVTSAPAPRTIHDFGGFPPELYQVQYPAPGKPDLAERIRSMLSPLPVGLDQSWGLDHGTWSILCHMFPQADIPVVQLSINESLPGPFHYETGRQLTALRDEGILILGSGNLVHNLHAYAWGKPATTPFEWALRFEKRVRDLIDAGNHRALAEYDTLGRDAQLSAPTPEHFLPLLYVLGARHPNEPVHYPIDGFDGGSISMLTVYCGELAEESKTIS